MLHIQRVTGLAITVQVSRGEQVEGRQVLPLLADSTSLREFDFLFTREQGFHFVVRN